VGTAADSIFGPAVRKTALKIVAALFWLALAEAPFLYQAATMNAQISWRELGSPSEPGVYRCVGTRVCVTQRDIDLASAALDGGERDVIFNATYQQPPEGEPCYLLNNFA
jgi:hypothetical protein